MARNETPTARDLLVELPQLDGEERTFRVRTTLTRDLDDAEARNVVTAALIETDGNLDGDEVVSVDVVVPDHVNPYAVDRRIVSEAALRELAIAVARKFTS